MFEQGMLLLVGEAFLETLFMTLVSTFFASMMGDWSAAGNAAGCIGQGRDLPDCFAE